MKLMAHRIDRAYWRKRPYIRKFRGGFVVFLSLFQVYFWWRAPTNEEPYNGPPPPAGRIP